MKKTLGERYTDEILTDNSDANYCAQCKKCKKWGNDPKDFFSNKHNKSNCDAFPYPGIKPDYVINNTNKCDYREI